MLGEWSGVHSILGLTTNFSLEFKDTNTWILEVLAAGSLAVGLVLWVIYGKQTYIYMPYARTTSSKHLLIIFLISVYGHWICSFSPGLCTERISSLQLSTIGRCG